MASLGKPGRLENIEVTGKAILRPEFFALREECLLPLERRSGMSLDMFSFSLAKHICLTGTGFGQLRDKRDLQTTLCDLVAGK